MKYRLKKDTPEFKTGSMFTRRKYEYGDYDDDCLFADISPGVSPVPAFDISLIDNFDEWFEEVKEEPKWVRKQIKQVVYHNAKTDILNWKYVGVKYRFIKGHFYYDSRTGFSINNKLDESEIRFFENANGDDLRRMLGYLNQLIRDGYIEIKNNPNIVWEAL